MNMDTLEAELENITMQHVREIRKEKCEICGEEIGDADFDIIITVWNQLKRDFVHCIIIAHVGCFSP